MFSRHEHKRILPIEMIEILNSRFSYNPFYQKHKKSLPWLLQLKDRPPYHWWGWRAHGRKVSVLYKTVKKSAFTDVSVDLKGSQTKLEALGFCFQSETFPYRNHNQKYLFSSSHREDPSITPIVAPEVENNVICGNSMRNSYGWIQPMLSRWS